MILGFGVEGRDVFQFLRGHFPDKELGIADLRPLETLGAEARVLLAGDRHVRLHLGPEHLRDVARYEVAVRSPGIPLRRPELQEARRRGTRLTSQTALFFALCTGRVIGVTGTKGKSTTTALIDSILRAAGRESHLVGNIGPELGGASPLLSLAQAGDRAIFVAELSSFQLEDLEASPEVAVLLDIVPEHLDHHGSFDAYLEAKAAITRHQGPRAWLVYDATSPTASAVAARSAAQLMPCRVDGPVEHGGPATGGPPSPLERGCFVEHDRIVYAAGFGREDLLAVSDVLRVLPGCFNLRNVLPAVAVARVLSVATEAIARGVLDFRPLRDRFERVGTFRDVTFYNAAIATVPEATIAHLAALAPQVGSVILGGVDRGRDYSALAGRLLADGVAALLLFPETGARIWECVEALARERKDVRLPRHAFVTDMEQAVRAAYELTPAGTICLHSPASPSRGGLFTTYAERGALFREWVMRLGA